jgi:hypothetical protein
MVETSFHKCILEDSADISRFDGLRCHPSAMTLEHKVITGKILSVDTQQDKQLGRNGHTAVFLAFPLIDEKLLAIKTDVNPFEAASLAHSERTVIDGGKKCLVIQVTPMKKKRNLLLGKHTREFFRFTHFGKDKSFGFLKSHDIVVLLQPEYDMLEKGNTVAIPVQEHRQIVVDVFLSEIVRQLVKIQHSLRNLQSVVIDSTVRVLSQAELLSEKGNSFFEFRNGLNGLVQISFVHFLVQGLLAEGLRDLRHLPVPLKTKNRQRIV